MECEDPNQRREDNTLPDSGLEGSTTHVPLQSLTMAIRTSYLFPRLSVRPHTATRDKHKINDRVNDRDFRGFPGVTVTGCS